MGRRVENDNAVGKKNNFFNKNIKLPTKFCLPSVPKVRNICFQIKMNISGKMNYLEKYFVSTLVNCQHVCPIFGVNMKFS